MLSQSSKTDDKFVSLNSESAPTPDAFKGPAALGEEVPKMFGILKVRDIGVTKTNVATMLTLEYTGMIVL